MTVDMAVEMGQSVLFMVLTLCAPVLLAALLVGIIVGLLQAITQLQEMTIGFVPRLLLVMVVLACLWPWMCDRLIEYSTALYRDIPETL